MLVHSAHMYQMQPSKYNMYGPSGLENQVSSLREKPSPFLHYYKGLMIAKPVSDSAALKGKEDVVLD